MFSCRFCNSKITMGIGEFPITICPVCGEYRILYDLSTKLNIYKSNRDPFRHFLYHHKAEDKVFYIGTKRDADTFPKDKLSEHNILVSDDEIENWLPKNIDERIDLILLSMAQRVKYVGDTFFLHIGEDDSLLLLNHDNINETDKEIEIAKQAEFILDAMKELGYVEYEVNETNFINVARSYEIKILVKGYSKIYDLQKNQSSNKDVFVAMSFHPSANHIRNAIKKAIDDAKYSSLLMDEIVHNHQIVPEMLRLIKESRFMIMDITQPNFGAYYEAGYAQGLGKEVIITCSQEVWDKKDFSCDKDENCKFKEIATKPHFDIAQKQVLKWKDYDDLTKQLAEWIRHIIG